MPNIEKYKAASKIYAALGVRQRQILELKPGKIEFKTYNMACIFFY